MAISSRLDPDREMRREFESLRDLTLPPGGRLISSTGIKRTRRGVEGAWEAELPGDWDAYRVWLARRLEPDFRLLPSRSTDLEFVRFTPNDSYYVAVAAVSSGAPVSLRVTYSAGPS